MSVTISKTNKPLNPRAKDLSPKGYNRASLYSGKALDFDGVNDSVSVADSDDLDGFTNFTYSVIAKADSTPNYCRLFDKGLDALLGAFNLSDQLYLYVNSTAIQFDYILKLNEYLHFTIVFTGGQDAKLYVNGVLEETQTHSIASVGTNSTNFAIGSNNALNGNVWDGHMSNARLFNTALTAGQVSDLYLNPEKIVPDGVADSALKLWLPMMEGAGTTVYDGSAPLTDYVTNGDFSNGTTGWTSSNATLSIEDGALKITSTGGNRPQANQIISGLTIGRKYLLSALARVGTTAFDMEIEIAGIAASSTYNKTSDSTFTYIYYEFTATSTSHQIQAKIDDGSVGVGETGYFDDIKLLDLGNYGSISGATWTSGVGAPVAQTALVGWNKMTPDHTNTILAPQGLTANKDIFGNSVSRNAYALNLDGASWAEVHDNASLDMADAITLEAWVYWDGTANDDGILARWGGATTNFMLYAVNSSEVRFYINADNSSYSSMTVGWHHIVGTYDKTNRKLYIDNVLRDTDPMTVAITTSSQPVEIGRFAFGGDREYPNELALPRIYNRALTATEVARNYNADKSKFGL